MTDYLGTLSPYDPLAPLLRRAGLEAPIAVYRLDHTGIAFRYESGASGLSLVGKFFGNKAPPTRHPVAPDYASMRMRQEFEALRHLRRLGLDRPPYQVVRPLAHSAAHNALLLQAYVPGQNLLPYIEGAIREGAHHALRARLGELARFLAELHERTRHPLQVDPLPALAYLDKLIRQLSGWGHLSPAQQGSLAALRVRWAHTSLLYEAGAVLIHGDATPANFIFQEGVTAIDLERLALGDRAADLGCVAAELKHFFLWMAQDEQGSEPFIEHLYESYAQQLGWAPGRLRALTERARFYMGCTELRISRNGWLAPSYRQQLIEHALGCLASR